MKISGIVSIAIVALFLILPQFALAQVPIPAEEPLVNQYLANTEVARKASWWNALGRQLAQSIDKAPAQVSEAEMQNIIFFATVHGEKVRLHDAIPGLLEVVDYHQDAQFRLMSVAALNAIGDKASLKELQRIVADDPSERVHRAAEAAWKNVR